MNEQDEEKWIKNERHSVIQYIKRNVEEYGNIGEWPAFHIAPIIAVWAVESKKTPGWVGFWAFSGNLPGDVIQRNWNDKGDNPRKALSRMNDVWRTYIKHLEIGNNPPNVNMGIDGSQRMDMAKMLNDKVKMFDEMVNDDDLWEDDCDK